MEYELKMPDLSAAADEVTITEWLVEVGDQVERGQNILAVETDKAQMDVESAVTGQLKQIVAGNDQTVAAGQVIAIFEVQHTTAAPRGGPQVTDETPRATEAPSEKPQPQVVSSHSTGRKGMFGRNRDRRGNA